MPTAPEHDLKTARPNPRRWARRRSLQRIAARLLSREHRLNQAIAIICASVIGLLWIGYAVYIDRREKLILNQAGRDTANLALAFEQQAERTIRAVDQVMLFVKSDYERDPDHFNLQSWAAERIYVDTLYHQIVIANADGLMIMQSVEMPRAPVYLSDREHFRVHADNVTDGLFISKPVLGRSSGKLSIQLSRRIDLNGRFGGMIVISLDPAYLSNLFAEADLGESGMIALVGHDGVLRASAPTRLAPLGETIPDSPLKRALGQTKLGTHLNQSGADARIESFRQVGERPLTIAVSVAQSALLTSVKREAHALVLVLTPLSVVLLALSVGLTYVIERRRRQQILLLRRSRQLSRANGAIEAANRELERRVAARTAELETNRRDLETTIDHLSATSAELAEQNKMASLGRVVAGVAHEINTPLGVAITATSAMAVATQDFATLFERDAIRKSDLTGYLAAANEASDMISVNLTRAAGLVRSFKQVAVDQHVGEPREVNLSAYMNDIITSLTPEIRHLGHRLAIAPSPSLMITLRVDALWQVMSNLVMNAVKHAFPNGRRGLITLTLAAENDEAVIRLHDDGVGMNAEVLTNIFEPFFTTRRGDGGTGLGLSIVHSLVHQSLGGRITCISAPNEGSEFAIYLPLTTKPASSRSIPLTR